MTLRVVAHMKSNVESTAEVRELLKGLVAPTREEPGCISYELLHSNDDPTQFTFVEEWRSEADLEAHFGTPHIQAVLERWDDVMSGQLDLRKYSKVG